MKKWTVIYSKLNSNQEKSKGFDDINKASDFAAEVLRDGGKYNGLLNDKGNKVTTGVRAAFETDIKHKLQKLISN